MAADLPARDAASAVAAVLAVTPKDSRGVGVVAIAPNGFIDVGDPTPIAARQAAAVLRWLSGWLEQRDTSCDDPAAVAQLADEIDREHPEEGR